MPDDAAPLSPLQVWAAVAALCRREIVRFFRQRSRLVGAIGQPVLFWVFFGAGFDQAFRLADSSGRTAGSFREYYFPGTLVLILLFTAIFATISIIEDRRAGFLQSVLVAPLPRWAMVLGKVLGGTLLAWIQGLAFLTLVVTLDVDWSLLRFVNLAALLFVASLSLTALGFVVAWRMESTQGFHAIMSVFLLPLWLLSGAFFPVPAVTAESTWLQIALHGAMRINPLTYTVGGVHQLLFNGPLSDTLVLPGLGWCWAITALFAVGMFAVACVTSRTRTAADLL